MIHHPRIAGRSKYGVWNRLGRGIVDLLMVRWLLKRQLPNITTIESASEQPLRLPGKPTNQTGRQVSVDAV